MAQDSTIAASVRAELARAKVTGRKLAANPAVGLSYRQLSTRLAGGDDSPAFSAAELSRIAAVLGIPVTRFYAGGDEPAAGEAASDVEPVKAAS